ncbi:hypothetical protein DPMN_150880 [Dreissena polymorpha]|uniref:Uncharacterized protein n=1 Tax=Dreissena polymorpha TaxID=45954 RepID=A0A9D4J6R7_DREPO|nr:hypothetical protein DPMN_150880 [Dreissena polymorpha]
MVFVDGGCPESVVGDADGDGRARLAGDGDRRYVGPASVCPDELASVHGERLHAQPPGRLGAVDTLTNVYAV